jgi:hypothetical protein
MVSITARIVLLLVALFICTARADAAVVHVQTINASDFSSGTTLTSGSFTTSAGDLLIAAIAYYDAQTITSVKLDDAIDFTLNISQTHGSDNAIRGHIYSVPNVSSGSHTVTVTWSSAALFKMLFVTEVSGAATTTPVDGAGVSDYGNGTSCSSGSYVAAGTSFWYGFAVAPNAGSFTAGTGWTIPTNGSDGSLFAAVEYKANPGSSPQTADMTIGSTNWICLGIAYAVPTVGTGHRHRLLLGIGH